MISQAMIRGNRSDFSVKTSGLIQIKLHDEHLCVFKQSAASREAVMSLTKSCHSSRLLSSSHCHRDTGLFIYLLPYTLKLSVPSFHWKHDRQADC